MAETNVPSTPADGNIKTVLVPAVADLSAPTVAEVTAATAVDISCYLTKGGFVLTVDQAVVADERECDRIVRQSPGQASPSLAITGIDNTNATGVGVANALAETLTRGSKWVAIRRRGLEFEDDLDGGEIVSVTEFTVGIKSEVAADANSVLRSTWNVFVTGHEPEATIVAA